MGLELDDLRRQNELINEQLEATRLNSEEIREQISLSKQLSQLAQVSRDAALRINRTNRELSDINKDVIDKLKERNNLSRKLSEIEKDLTKSQKIHASLETEINELLDKQGKIRGRNSIASKKSLQNIIDGLREQQANNGEINKSLEREYSLVEQINGKLGLAPALAEGLGKALNKLGFGNLSKQLKLEEVVQDTRNWVAENEGNVSSFGILAKFSGGILKNIGGLLSPMNILQASIGLLVKSMSVFDKMSGETAKNLGISYEEASKINQEFTQIAANSSNTFITTKALSEAQNLLSTSLGTNRELSGEILVNFTELTKQAGYSVEAATVLSKLSLTTGKSAEALTKSYLGQVKALNAVNGLSINGKQLLNDISNVSKATLVTFSKHPEKLAAAAFEAKKVGLELKEIEGISQSLLNIESSISSEFEAEILTGKAINLERARYYALTNDIAGLAQEINKQGVTSTSFGKMNVLQQESIAKALGMSRDQMGKMLIEQESIQAVGAKDLSDLKAKYEAVKGTSEEQEFLNKLGNEEYARQLKSTSTQERFLALTEKLQELFISMAGPIMDIVSPLINLVSYVLTPIANIFTDIKSIIDSIIDPTKSLADTLANMGPLAAGIATALAIAGTAVSLSLVPGLIRAAAAAAMALPSMISMAVAAISTASATTLGIGALAIIGGIAASVAAMRTAHNSVQMDDGMVGPDGGMILSGKKGSIQLNKDDSVIAGTNLMGGSSEGITQLSSTLGNKMDIMIGKLDSLIGAVNKGMTVNLDGNKVSQELAIPLAINNRRT